MEQRPHDPNSLRTDSEGYITAWMLQRGIPGSNQFATTFNVSSMVNNVLLLNSVCRDMLHLINRALQRKKHLSALLHCFGHFVTLRPNNSITLARRCYKEQRFRTSFTIGFQKWIIPCEEISEPCPRRSSSWTIRRGTRNIPRCSASVDRQDQIWQGILGTSEIMIYSSSKHSLRSLGLGGDARSCESSYRTTVRFDTYAKAVYVQLEERDRIY